jgi:glucan phosphorylase
MHSQYRRAPIPSEENSMAAVPPQTTPSAATFLWSIRQHARYALAQPSNGLSTRQIFECVSLAVRDIMVDRLLESEERFRKVDAKHLYYISIEYLPGRFLDNSLINLGLYEPCQEALRQMGTDLEDVVASERDPALGNGGLGRLAACFLDSLATLDMPGYGYGINYEYGLFRQEIDRGDQREKPDNWLAAVRRGRSSGRRRPASFPSTAGLSIPLTGRALTTRCGSIGGSWSAFPMMSSSWAMAAAR